MKQCLPKEMTLNLRCENQEAVAQVEFWAGLHQEYGVGTGW